MTSEQLYTDQLGHEHPIPDYLTPKKRVSCYAAIISNNKLLLVRQQWDHKLVFPGGKIDDEETVKDALFREVREEAGHELASFSTIPFYVKNNHFFELDHKDYFESTMQYYFGQITHAKNATPKDVNEIESIEWKPIEEIKEEQISQSQREAYVALKQHLKNK
ncbi:MAG: NUDIX hydrolase [Candidatus Diapherotrites archaeon]|uniref:NUDIX hydrolase n=1 Tax=Candidatus Iainarchaeum sp. TaxID=3101447 RepID=A0A8T4L5F0_9ARCH|nr:NUDIX hydrolase [Candidatus Diapherotrites archaeon]